MHMRIQSLLELSGVYFEFGHNFLKLYSTKGDFKIYLFYETIDRDNYLESCSIDFFQQYPYLQEILQFKL